MSFIGVWKSGLGRKGLGGNEEFQFGLQVGYWIYEFELRVESLSLCITSTNHMY